MPTLIIIIIINENSLWHRCAITISLIYLYYIDWSHVLQIIFSTRNYLFISSQWFRNLSMWTVCKMAVKMLSIGFSENGILSRCTLNILQISRFISLQ